MPKILPIQESFAAGEISPRIYGRQSIDGYKYGVESMENFITTPQGPFYRRKGFKFCDSRTYLNAGTRYSRILPFNTPSGDYFVIFDSKLSDYIKVVRLADDMSFTDAGISVTISYGPGGWSTTFFDYTLQYAVTPDGNTMYVVGLTHGVYKIVHTAGSPDVFDFDIVTFTSPPAVWAGSGHPYALEFHQDRLWFGGGRGANAGIWASKSGDYENFTTGAADDDALDFRVQQKGTVLWLKSVRKLLVGTDFNEYTISADGGVITPSDIQVDLQTEYGSSQIQPIRTGNSVVYVSSDGRKIREVDYSWTDDNWNSKDLMFVSEHLTRNDRIIGLAFAQVPDYLLFVRTLSGALLIATYDKANGIIGWHTHDTDAEVIDVCSLRDSDTVAGRDVVLASFIRSFTALTNYYEVYGGEWYNVNSLLKTTDEQYLDCWHLVENSPASTAVTGVTALASQTVGVIVDGAVHPDITLDGSGDGTLNWAGESIIVGLNYTSTMKTLPLARSAPFGSSLAMKKRWSKIWVKIVNSAIPLINGNRPPTRYPATTQGEPESLKTIDIQVANLGWDNSAQIEITQDLPLETMISTIYGEAEEEIT